MPGRHLVLTLAILFLPSLAACSGRSAGSGSVATATSQPVPTLINPTIESTEEPAGGSEGDPTASPVPSETASPSGTALVEAGDGRVFSYVGQDPAVPVVARGPAARWDGKYLNPGGVLYHDGLFHMFRNGFTDWPGLVEVGYMTSPDGLVWTEVQEEPVFSSDQVPYLEEGEGVDVSSVVVMDDGTWVMYFHRVSTTNPGVIGRATAVSPAGPWEVDPEPVLLPGAEGAWDAAGLEWPSVQKTTEGLVMYYSGRPTGLGQRRIGRAASQDGIEWVKYDDPATTDALVAESDPVLAAEESWTTSGVDRARVQLTPEGWVMVYQGGALVKRGLAFSTDGIRWTPHPENPVLELQDFPLSGTMWDTNLLYQDGVYYYYTELGSMAGTDIYLAVHAGDIIPADLPLPEPAVQDPAAELPEGVLLLEHSALLAPPGSDPVYTSLLDTNIIVLGTHTLGAGVEEAQAVHGQDEVYYVLEGEAVLDLDGEKIPVSSGSLVYAHAGLPRHFEDVSQDLQVLDFISKRSPSSDDPPVLSFELESLLAGLGGQPGENTFVDAATLDGRLVSLAPGETLLLDGGWRSVYTVLEGGGRVLLGDMRAEISEGMLLYYPRQIPTSLEAGDGGLVFLEIAATE